MKRLPHTRGMALLMAVLATGLLGGLLFIAHGLTHLWAVRLENLENTMRADQELAAQLASASRQLAPRRWDCAGALCSLTVEDEQGKLSFRTAAPELRAPIMQQLALAGSDWATRPFTEEEWTQLRRAVSPFHDSPGVDFDHLVPVLQTLTETREISALKNTLAQRSDRRLFTLTLTRTTYSGSRAVRTATIRVSADSDAPATVLEWR